MASPQVRECSLPSLNQPPALELASTALQLDELLGGGRICRRGALALLPVTGRGDARLISHAPRLFSERIEFTRDAHLVDAWVHLVFAVRVHRILMKALGLLYDG